MKTKFSVHWKKSKQPRKKRKYLKNAPLHIKRSFLSAHLSKELRKKYNRRSIPVRKGDKVKVMRGSFKGKTGIVDRVDVRKTRVYIRGIEIVKMEGSKITKFVHPSNLEIVELNLEDKERKKILERSGKNVKAH